MEDTSFVKIHRKILYWEWYTHAYTVHLFTHLIIKANYIDKPWQGKTIKKGELISSLNKLSLETGISVRGVRTCLKNLIKSKNIIVKTTNKYTHITICNITVTNIITNRTTSRRHTKRHSNAIQMTNKTTIKRQQLKNIKKRKNLKNLIYYI